jgi:hypothetical protein
VLNATQLSVHCKAIVIPGLSFEYFRNAARHKAVSLYSSPKSQDRDWVIALQIVVFNRPPAIERAWHYRNGMQIPDLCDILSEKALCMTRPQDRVYALMHLANDYVEGGIVVDYTKSKLDILVEAAAYHVQVHRNLRFLQDAYLQVSSSGHKSGDQRLNASTWLPCSWLGDVYQSLAVDRSKTTITSCLAKSISKADRRLHMRAMRVDYVRSCLNRGLTSKTLSICQFWNSSLGSYLRDFAGPGADHLSPTALEVLFMIYGSEIAWYAELVKVYSKAGGDNKFQSDWDENDKDGICATLREASSSALSVFLQLSQDSLHADRYIFQDGMLDIELLEGAAPVTMVTLFQLLWHLDGNFIIETRTKGLGRVAECAIDDGDEIWIALGFDLPIVLRPQSNGSYWFVCAADIPEIRDDEDLKQFTSDVQPGDKIGEWVVEDIEIE